MRWWFAFAFVLVMLLTTAALPADVRAATASCYGNSDDGFLGRPTADGTIVTARTIGVAHRTFSFDTWLMIKVDGRKPVRARVFDRGPYSGHRTIDVTEALARAVGIPDCDHWGVRTIRTWRAH